MTDHDLPTRTEGEGETLDMPEGMKGFTSGQVLGERYQVLELLGRGGMGEVWHAFDLKLRVDVALKALREDLFKSERRLEMLRDEVRAAREVVSPNVCRIFDLIEVEGRELVSMEYVDGATLLGVLQERGPLELKEAQDIASQFLAGLEAIHKAGLIHRDIKPENIMLTRAGRVVVMDFGLARQETEGGGTVAGTPAYMSPEQAAGQTLDARADVYAAGVVLAEMVSPDGIKSFDSRQSVWEGVRSEPAKVPDTPWAPVIQQAVKKDREGRFNSAHTLTRALEDVTLRVEGADDLHPYPGLASFTEEDAEYFFGREAEVEQMWRKLEGPPRMLGLVGPSGAGKTSFLNAGLIPAARADWAAVVCTPGSDPRAALRRALISQLEGDAEALRELAEGSDTASASAVARWRQRHGHAVVIVDQFEELFTQNTPDEQHRFTALLGRLVLEADAFVLLSMRDDFLIHCNRHEALRPLFSELTPVDPPSGGSLRRALTQPALQCGYRFEDDELVDEMLAEVEGERGALPLLAFAAARLWEKRDRESGLLTRQAYQDIGGVGGALARHAEATIDRIGHERLPIVRELFRNLVTAEGTRAVREWSELLSIFPDSRSESGAAVLRALIDARLLTSYEVREEDREPTRRVEIIHESLLANWPRLVRWQTQDQEGAQLRDELRQAAKAWDEHGRHDDRLWTGTAFREYQLWRERYSGGLTDLEEAFGSAMTSLAGRRRHRRRIVVATVITVLVAGLAVIGSFWQRSVRETRRAEAANLVSLGQLELESYPSATVAHTIASLELADDPAARLLAQEALWKGPLAMVVNQDATLLAYFTADGDYLAQTIEGGSNHIRVTSRDGSSRLFDSAHDAIMVAISLSPTGSVLRSEDTQTIVLWSTHDGRRLAEARYQQPSDDGFFEFRAWNPKRALVFVLEQNRGRIEALSFDGNVERLGSLDFDLDRRGREWMRQTTMDSETGQWFGAVENGDVSVIEIGDHGLSAPRLLGRQEGSGIRVAFHPQGRFFATANAEGEIRLWDPTGTKSPMVLQGPRGIARVAIPSGGSLLEAVAVKEGIIECWAWSLDAEGPRPLRRINVGPTGTGGWRWDLAGRRVARGGPDSKVRLWSLETPADAEPLTLQRGDVGKQWVPSFHPRGDFLATADTSGLSLWPLSRQFPIVIRLHDEPVWRVVFEPQGRWLASGGRDNTVRLWPLDGEVPTAGRVVFESGSDVRGLAVSPDGAQLLVGGDGPAEIVPLDGGPSTTLDGSEMAGVAFSADGRFAAAVGNQPNLPRSAVYVWEVGSWEEPTILEPEQWIILDTPHFLADGSVLSPGASGLWRSDPATGEHELLYEGILGQFAVSANERRIALVETSELSFGASGRAIFLDLDDGTTTPLESHGEAVWAVALDPTGTTVVTGDKGGVIRVGPVTGEEPHLLLGHEGRIWSVDIDPLGRWIASGGEDATVRLWPMPDLSKPPLHTLPREELIAKLKTLTNLRVVRDPESSTGWKLTHDPFPGWETVPTW